MLSEEQSVNDRTKPDPGRKCKRFRVWDQMPRLGARKMELALQILGSDIDVPHGHLWIGTAE
jgi:hypothetical protein